MRGMFRPQVLAWQDLFRTHIHPQKCIVVDLMCLHRAIKHELRDVRVMSSGMTSFALASMLVRQILPSSHVRMHFSLLFRSADKKFGVTSYRALQLKSQVMGTIMMIGGVGLFVEGYFSFILTLHPLSFRLFVEDL